MSARPTGIRLRHLPPTPLPNRPRRPLDVRLRGWLLRPKVERVLSAAGLVAVAVVGGWLAWR